MTESLVALLNYVNSVMTGSPQPTGQDWGGVLYQHGASAPTDLKAQNAIAPNCPSPSSGNCADTVTLCDTCVGSDVPGNILYGFAFGGTVGLDIAFSDSDFANFIMHWQSDSTMDKTATEVGFFAHQHATHDKGVLKKTLCTIFLSFNDASIKKYMSTLATESCPICKSEYRYKKFALVHESEWVWLDSPLQSDPDGGFDQGYHKTVWSCVFVHGEVF
ncbi:MAG: hypothetical protein IPH13_05185 [Planctomycetes bacterium]|nr:hypothetical protein [Planctomycetota bacterium]